MKPVSSILAQTFAVGLCLLAAVGNQPAQAQPVTNYWDINGSTPGAGGPTPSGNWEDPSWSLDPTGSSATAAWTEGNVPAFAAGSDATGTYTITANNNHTVAGIQAPTGAVTINGPGVLSIATGMQQFVATNLTINANLSGTGGFESSASNNISLFGNDDYSGGTILNGGSTYINSASSLGTGTVSPILGGTNATFSALFSTVNTVTLTNAFSVTTSNAGIVFVPGTSTPLTLSGNVNVQQDFYCRNNGPGSSVNPGAQTGVLTLSGNISGPGGMILSCNGDNNSTIALTGSNTYTGRTIADPNGGTRIFINFNSAQPIGSGIPNSLGEPPDAATGQINLGHPQSPTLSFSDALRYTGSTDSTTDRTINNANADPAPGGMWLFAEGTGAITYSGNITAAASTTARTLIVQGSSTALNTISGAISDGAGGVGVINVTKESPSTWRLLGTNTFTGTLTVQNTTGLGGTSTLILGGSNVYAGTTAISANSVLQLAGPNPVPHGPGHGSFTIAANGKFELAGNNCFIDGGGGAGMIDNNTGTATLTIDNNTVNVGPTFSGVIQDSGSGVLNFVANCSGQCLFSSPTGNPYHGYTAVNNAIIAYTNENQLGVVPATLVTNDIIIDSAVGWNGTSNSGNYYLRAATTPTLSLSATRGIYLGNANGYGGGIGAQSTTTLSVNGPISGPGALFSGGGTPHAATGIVILNATNTYQGGTYIVGGTLRLGANNVLPFGTPVVMSDTQNHTFGMNTHNQTIGTLTGNNFSQVGLNSGALTIRETAPTTFAGVINQNNGSLILDSSSTSALTLTGTNTFTGTTVINGGTLALSANGSINATASITIGNKGTFDVSGLNTALTLGTNILNAGGTGGFSATVATAASKGLTMGATTPLNFTAYDGSTVPLTISGAGTMTLAAGNPVTVTVTGSPLGGGTYKLISKGASGSVAGTVPTSLTVAGAGTVANTTNSLSINNGELFLNVVGGLSPVTQMSIAPAGGGNLSINYSGGAGSQFVLLQSSNVTVARTNWIRVQTNTVSPGSFSITPGSAPVEFYSIQSQ